MKIKKYLPLIAILLFSCLFAFCVTFYIVFSSNYPENITARLMVSLEQGIGLSVVLFLLLMVGWGINTLLAKIQDTSRRRLFSLGVYLGSFVLCIALPAILIVSTYFVFSQQKGWQKLPSVPAPAVQVAAIGKDAVIVRSDDGNFYYCWTEQLEQCWETADEPVKPLLQNYEGELKPTTNPPGVTPPDGVIDIAGVAYNNSATFLESHYAVTSDGKVWYLNHETNNGTAGLATGFLFIFMLPLMLGTLAILAGAGISGAVRSIANRIWRETE